MSEVRTSSMPPNEWRPDIPLNDPLIFRALAQPKHEQPDKDGEGALYAASLAGTKAHFVVSHADDPDRAFESLWHALNDHLPPVVQLWSLAVFDALDDLRRLHKPDEGYESKTLSEVSLTQSQLSLEAGVRLETALILERASGTEDGPVAKVLRAFYREEGYRVIDEEVARLIDENRQFLPDSIEDDLFDASTHTMGHDGKLVWLPAIRGDAFRFTYKCGDERVKQTVEAFSQILRSGQARDQYFLAGLQFDFGAENSTDLKDGFDIMHDIAEMMMNDSLIVDVDEYKTKTMIGKDFGNITTKAIWNRFDGDVGKLLGSINHEGYRLSYRQWKENLEKDKLDMAKTSDALLNTILIGVQHHCLKNGLSMSNEAIRKSDLATKLRGNVVWIGLDIRQDGSDKYMFFEREVDDDEAPRTYLQTKSGEQYILLPDVSILGVPDRATFGKHTVSGEPLMGLIADWEKKVYEKNRKRHKEIIARVIGGLALDRDAAHELLTKPYRSQEDTDATQGTGTEKPAKSLRKIKVKDIDLYPEIDVEDEKANNQHSHV